MRSTTRGMLIDAAKALARDMERLRFVAPVRYVYNPLLYAWPLHEQYLSKLGATRKRVVLVGMNPGPWGMAQTGVPFGEVGVVRDWLGIRGQVGKPRQWHRRVPVTGLDCPRSEVSGSRLWGLLKEHYGRARELAKELLVANYCPLLFLDDAGRNLTPDKIARDDRAALHEVCDRHLKAVIEAVRPEWVIGIGRFAEGRVQALLPVLPSGVRAAGLPHPSPASPQANRGWAELARRVLVENGIWPRG